MIQQGRMSRGLNQICNSMMKREATSYYADADLRAVSPGRFQVLEVEQDISIKAFVLENGLTFKVGRGFYEFTKTETIQGHGNVTLSAGTTNQNGTIVVLPGTITNTGTITSTTGKVIKTTHP